MNLTLGEEDVMWAFNFDLNVGFGWSGNLFSSLLFWEHHVIKYPDPDPDLDHNVTGVWAFGIIGLESDLLHI